MKIKAFVAGICCSTLAWAQFGLAAEVEIKADSKEPKLSIEQLVAEALEKNPELKFYEAELTAAKAGRKSAGVFPNPELSGSVGHKRVSAGNASAEGLAWSVSVVQPFEWPGRIGLRKAIANRDIELATLGLERFKVALASRVRMLAYSVFAAQEKAKAAHEVANRFQELREVLIQRDPAGLTPQLEMRVIEATELTSHRKASQETVELRSSFLGLNQLRGRPPEEKLAIAASDFTFDAPQDMSLLLAMARTNNFELRVRMVELNQQGLRVDLARNERYPTISVGPAYSEEKAGDRERVLGVGVTVPLPLWNRNAGNIESAKARQDQAETLLMVSQKEVERKVVEAAIRLETKLNEMKKWRPDSVEHFREAAELADRHYRLGSVPVATFVELQRQYLEAVEALLETKKEALEAAQDIELLTGGKKLTTPFADKKESK